LRAVEEQLACAKCAACFPVREGTPSFVDTTTYWGEISYEDMRRANQVARERGWLTALNEVVRPLCDVGGVEYFVDPNRADWRFALPSLRDWRVADLGAGWGPLTFALAPFCREVVALEAIWERARFMEVHRTQAGVSNVKVIHADACRLPFVDETFDLVVVNGLLEWVALWNRDGDPREVQRAFLARVRRILRPGGWLYVGVENRIGEKSLRGDKDHSGLPYTMLMPRRMADWWMRRWPSGYRSTAQQGYRTYTYSYYGYRKLMREAGLELREAYWVLPSYNMPRNMISLANRHVATFYLRPPDYRQSLKQGLVRVAKRALMWLGGAKLLASDFCFLAQRV
jgi:SAM-dependent methyltransferase